MIIALLILGGWLGLLALARRQFVWLALLGFPGVVLHELLHWTVGLLLLARPCAINLVPRRAGPVWQFGSVSFTGLNLFNAAPVALAPLLLLWLVWLGLVHWMLPAVLSRHYLSAVLIGYGLACGLFYSRPSRADLRLGGWSIACWLLVAASSWAVWSGYFNTIQSPGT